MAASDDGEMSFLDHLEELRWRIIKSLAAIVVCAIPCGVFWKKIFDILMIYPLRSIRPQPRLIFTQPVEAVMLSLKITAFGGVIMAAPVVFYQLWRFIAPGLYKKEKAVVLPVVFASSVCFLLGMGFCYTVMPFLVNFLATYGAGRMEAMFRVQDFMGFLIMLMLAFGMVFELPVISFILTKAGVLTPRFLIDKIRYAIVVIFIVAAVLTPPDVVSQILMAVPLLLLYGISIIVSYLAARKRHD